MKEDYVMRPRCHGCHGWEAHARPRRRLSTARAAPRKQQGAPHREATALGTGRLAAPHEIPRVRRVDVSSLGHAPLCPATPVVITGLMDGWPALQHWTAAKLQARPHAQGTVVPVEFGGNYMDEKMQRVQLEFSEVMAFMGKSERGDVDVGGIGHLYLAQVDLADVGLEEDVVEPTDLISSVGRGLLQRTNFWCGIKGVVSPCHQDPFYNVLCQVTGEKYVRLYPPEQVANLYPAAGAQKNTSEANDVEHPDLARFPLVAEANKTALETVLQPGESLFIPLKYWHHCRSLTMSMSVNFWWL